MTSRIDLRIGPVASGLYLICTAAFVLAIGYNHVQLITHEVPLDYNEAGMLVITSTISQGQNPHSLESQPSHMSAYPVLYNMLVAPASRLLGNTLELHRAATGFFILACSALCFVMVRRQSGSRLESVVASALVYAGLLYYSTPISGPNSLGLFLFLATIILPWVYGFSTRSLCSAVVLGVLAFYAKQYFVACLGYVALYLFLAGSKKRGLLFGMSALAVFLAVLALVSYTSPYFLDNTVFAVKSASDIVSSRQAMVKQLLEYSQIYLPLLVIPLVALIHVAASRAARAGRPVPAAKPGGLLNLLEPDAPLLRRKPDYIWFCCACSLVIIMLLLGRNPGNHLTYLFQLISPFLLAGVFSLIAKAGRWQWLCRALVLVALYNSYTMLPKDFTVEEKNWKRIRDEIAGAEDIYASTVVLGEIIDKGGPVYLNGHTRYFVLAQNKPSFLQRADPQSRVGVLWERHVERIHDKVDKQEFDLILIDQWLHLPKSLLDPSLDANTLLKERYRRSAVIRLSLANRLGGGKYTVQVWKPKPVKK